jgi:uncharacterized membrane protein YhaH (DUF805 family)
MSPVFALVVALLWLPLPFIQSRQLSSETIAPEQREVLERRATAPFALLISGAATLLLLAGSWFAARAASDYWWVWLLAAVLFVVNFFLALWVRRKVTGQWLGGAPKQTGKRALATRLGILAAIVYVGTYVMAWAAGPSPATWVTVLSVVLLGAFFVLMVAVGFLIMFAMQEDANEEWERDRRA